jgi:pterin-4a-carbinolamine dehydratase
MNNPNDFPVKVVQNPIIATNRWCMIKDEARNIVFLQKDYDFNCPNKFSMFIHDIIDYQLQLQHFAEISTRLHDTTHCVTISLWTQNINQCTDIDREFARYCDITYRNLFTNDQTII